MSFRLGCLTCLFMSDQGKPILYRRLPRVPTGFSHPRTTGCGAATKRCGVWAEVCGRRPAPRGLGAGSCGICPHSPRRRMLVSGCRLELARPANLRISEAVCSGGLDRKSLSGPHLRGMQHAQHRHHRHVFGIDHDVVRSDNQFPCALYPAKATAFWMRRELRDPVLDFLHQGKGCVRVVIRQCNRRLPSGHRPQEPAIPVQASRFPSISARASCIT